MKLRMKNWIEVNDQPQLKYNIKVEIKTAVLKSNWCGDNVVIMKHKYL